MTVPEVLVSGDHARIAAWRRQQAAERTRLRRPDLWLKYNETKDQPPAANGQPDRRPGEKP